MAPFAAILCTSCSDSSTRFSSPKTSIKQSDDVDVRQPESLSIDEVNLKDEDLVIGVSVGVKHRAYLVEALAAAPELLPESGTDVSGQVINDLIGEVPISVTYCGETKLCRVLTSSGNEPLDLVMSASRVDGLELILNGQRFRQSDPQLPLQDYAFELTTWTKWKSAHPQTDVYLGSLDKG